MSLFKSVSNINIEEPTTVNFDGKHFHLSGDFAVSKKDFGKELEKLGATYSGIRGDTNHKSHLSLKDTDYLILANDGITQEGNKKDFGNNAKKVQAHNDKPNQEKHIQIIKESHCKKLMDEAMRNIPKP